MNMLSAHRRYQRGFTPIELMIALTLGGLLSASMFQILISSKQVYKMQDNISKLQENGRFALSFIARDVRNAGYRLCYTDTPDLLTSVAGTEGTSGSTATIFSGTSGVTNTINITPLSDVLELGRTSPQNVCAPIPPPPASPPPPRNTTSDIRIAYSVQVGASGRSSLFRSIGTVAPATNPGYINEEVVEGVEDMQVLYGPDTEIKILDNGTPADPSDDTIDPTSPGDGAANYYAPANSPGLDMRKVVSIRVSLLLQSNDDFLTSWASDGSPVPFYYNGAMVTRLDHRLRRVFSTTIAVRNRLK